MRVGRRVSHTHRPVGNCMSNWSTYSLLYTVWQVIFVCAFVDSQRKPLELFLVIWNFVKKQSSLTYGVADENYSPFSKITKCLWVKNFMTEQKTLYLALSNRWRTFLDCPGLYWICCHGWHVALAWIETVQGGQPTYTQGCSESTMKVKHTIIIMICKSNDPVPDLLLRNNLAILTAIFYRRPPGIVC